MRTDGFVVVVIETPSGSGNKLKFDSDLGVYRLDRVLPAGMTFPFEFGFIPRTLGEDGDPLDAIVLLDAPIHPGCVVRARLIGVIEAEQLERGASKWERNDRVVAVRQDSRRVPDRRRLPTRGGLVRTCDLEKQVESFLDAHPAPSGECLLKGIVADRFSDLRKRIAGRSEKVTSAGWLDAI